ncbi:MAG: hypothetical protein CL840_08030 [Crocinitomicaceae bacterium]|nr:hypothetical protein [Crocinitomicaceae bacterium]
MFRAWIVFLGMGMLIGLVGCDSEPSSENVSEILKENARKKAEYLEKGNQIAKASFEALSGKLKNTIATDGIEGAIRTCNIHASPLVDSLSNEYGATIKRTSLKIRNEVNSPSPDEKHILKLYSRAKDANETLMPIVLLDSNWVSFYSPILVKPICLNCHGEPNQDLDISTIDLLRSMYPTDRAYGYKEDELRGIWSIKFESD